MGSGEPGAAQPESRCLDPEACLESRIRVMRVDKLVGA